MDKARTFPFGMAALLARLVVDALVPEVEALHFSDVIRRNRDGHFQFTQVVEEVFQLIVHAICEQLVRRQENSRFNVRKPPIIGMVGRANIGAVTFPPNNLGVEAVGDKARKYIVF